MSKLHSNFENVLVMGKSGAGKQSRVDVFVRELGLKHLSTGNIFRKYLSEIRKINCLSISNDELVYSL